MDANGDQLNSDELFSIMKEAMVETGLTPIDRTRFDEILKFNSLCRKLIEKSDDDYEFPFIYLSGMLFNRLTPEGRKVLLRDFEQEMDGWS